MTGAMTITNAFAGDLSAKGKARATHAANVLTVLLKNPLKDPKNQKVIDEMDNDDSDKPDLKPSHVMLMLKWLDAAFPAGIIPSAQCMVVIPSEKTISAGFGGSYGAGLATCRTEEQVWSKPIFVKLTGGELGSVGIESTDLVLLFGEDISSQIITSPSFKLGIDAGIVFGHGRNFSVGSNAHFKEFNIAYSHSKGAYLGFSVNGMVLSPDKKMNEAVYGDDFDIKAILNTDADPENSEDETLDFVTTISTIDDVANAVGDQ